MVAVILDCTAIDVPSGVRFGHECAHGEGPHPIRVVVHEEGTDAGVYGPLRQAAERRASVVARGTAARALRQAAAVHERNS